MFTHVFVGFVAAWILVVLSVVVGGCLKGMHKKISREMC